MMNEDETTYFTDYSRESTPELLLKTHKKQGKRKKLANYKTKVQQLETDLASLLAKKKSLNSKVVSSEFEAFHDAVEKIQNDEGSAADVKQTLVGLEKALKKEGLFKNVKALFVRMKKDFLSAPSSKPPPPLDLDALDDDENKKESKSRSTTAVYTHRGDHTARKYAQTVHVEDVKSVNRAVGKLFGHLRPPKTIETKDTTFLSVQGRSSTIVKSKEFDDTNFSDVIKRLKQFEKELNRQRASQQGEITRLAEENNGLKKSMVELRKEHERLKGTHPIVSKAKDKQVQQLEKKFRTQKRGMEGKIEEIESELQVSLERTLKEKDVLEQMIMDGVSRLKSAIIDLHQKLCAGSDRQMTTILEKNENEEGSVNAVAGDMSVDELMKNIGSIEEEANILQERNDRLQAIINEKESEIHNLRTAISDISKEISKMHGATASIDGSLQVNLGQGAASTSVKGLDKKEKELAIAKLQQVNASIQQYKRLLQEGSKSNVKQSNDLKPLRKQIDKMYAEFKQDVERFQTEKSTLSMKTLYEDPNNRDDVNIMLQKLTKIEKAYKVMKEKDSDNTDNKGTDNKENVTSNTSDQL